MSKKATRSNKPSLINHLYANVLPRCETDPSDSTQVHTYEEWLHDPKQGNKTSLNLNRQLWSTELWRFSWERCVPSPTLSWETLVPAPPKHKTMV